MPTMTDLDWASWAVPGALARPPQEVGSAATVPTWLVS